MGIYRLRFGSLVWVNGFAGICEDPAHVVLVLDRDGRWTAAALLIV